MLPQFHGALQAARNALVRRGGLFLEGGSESLAARLCDEPPRDLWSLQLLMRRWIHEGFYPVFTDASAIPLDSGLRIGVKYGIMPSA